MNPPRFDEVRAAHHIYCEHVGYQLPLTLHVRELFERWVVAGYTVEDLRLVLRRWTRKIHMDGTDAGVLRLSRLLEPTVFSEDLCLAHAERKMRQSPTPKERALEQLRPTMCEPRNGVDAKTGREAAISALEKLKRDLGGN